jgi:ABC-type multidrug transport system ATPase subunit
VEPPKARGPVVLRVRDLVKEYGKLRALSGVSLEVGKGEVVGFLGPNGAGKTTFTKCVLGFLRPTSGSVELFGKPVDPDTRQMLAKVGLVPDQYDFYGTLNGVQHLAYYGRLYGMSQNRIQKRTKEVIELLGMKGFVDRKVHTYSHGMKQRLCIAQALLNEPEFVIFDEPTNGLDPRGAYEIRDLIRNLSEGGTTVFLSSHILSEVEQVCSRVAIISKGVVIEHADVADLRKKIAGDEVKVVVLLDEMTKGLAGLPVGSGLAREAHVEGQQLVCSLSSRDEVPELVRVLVEAGAKIHGVQEQTVGLEQVFLELTKGEGGY